ncbi:MAG: hypothetical protein EB071_10750 [Gammaproteobacteria bacterium]|nr:hypothetical protein [Gammaproteobacteria bacterium]
MNTTLTLLAVTLGLMALQESEARASETAADLLKGGTFCFQVGTPIPGGWDTKIKLVSERAKGGAPRVISVVSGLYTGFKATNPPQSYTSEMVGSATVASPSDHVQGTPTLDIGLSSSDYGLDPNSPSSGIWTGQYALTLKTSDLSGKLTAKKHFTPIVNGKPPVETYSESIDQPVQLISCKGY